MLNFFDAGYCDNGNFEILIYFVLQSILRRDNSLETAREFPIALPKTA